MAYTALSSVAGPAASKPSTVSSARAAGKGTARRASRALLWSCGPHGHHKRAVAPWGELERGAGTLCCRQQVPGEGQWRGAVVLFPFLRWCSELFKSTGISLECWGDSSKKKEGQDGLVSLQEDAPGPSMTLGLRASLTAPPSPDLGEDLLPNPFYGFSPFRSKRCIRCSKAFPGLGPTRTLSLTPPCPPAPFFPSRPPALHGCGPQLPLPPVPSTATIQPTELLEGHFVLQPLPQQLLGHHPGQLPIRCPVPRSLWTRVLKARVTSTLKPRRRHHSRRYPVPTPDSFPYFYIFNS